MGNEWCRPDNYAGERINGNNHMTKWQKKLIAIAEENIDKPNSGKLHFSFLLKKKKIISWGVNKSWESHPLANKYGTRFNTIHSELDCIIKFPYLVVELPNFTLVNIRLLKNGTVAMAKPCKFCERMINQFGIKKVFYTDVTGKFVAL